MDDRLTIEELVAGLAAKQNIVQADAEAFVCSFLVLIEEGLKKDKYVRIKGFGTFKLIDADLNEGRIVFIPESSVRDAVNKPFSHFEPVELKDDVRFDDVEEELVSARDETSVASDKAECRDDAVVEEKRDLDFSDDSDVNDVSRQSGEPAVIECDAKLEVRKSKVHWYMLAAILFVGIVIGGGIMWGIISHRIKSEAVVGMEYKTVETEPADVVSADSADRDSGVVIEEYRQDTVQVKANQKTIDSIIKVATEDKNEIKFLSDEVTYRISGTMDEYTISKGSTLSKVAYRYYKNRKLWPYIVMHNKDIIQDPNNVPIGTVLRIPVLTPVK